MSKSNEIIALLKLVDDPDSEVYNTVADTILRLGKEIIPSLERLWEVTVDEDVQERIETLIHRVHFQDLQEEFLDWNNSRKPDLLKGAILLAKFQYPELNEKEIFHQFDRIRRNVWLELNSYLTALEQINVINSILYNYYKFVGHEFTNREPRYFCINQTLESKQGNPYTIGILYLALCELLDVPVFAIEIPRQFVFAYIDTLFPFQDPDSSGIQQVQFFIDPLNGMVYTINDVELYLKKINSSGEVNYFSPLSARKVMCKMMEELSNCYKYNKDMCKVEELQQLIAIIESENE